MNTLGNTAGNQTNHLLYMYTCILQIKKTKLQYLQLTGYLQNLQRVATKGKG